MARRIPTTINTVTELASIVDSELQKLSVEGAQGFVASTQPVDKSRSYLFVDKDGLKFFNAITKETTALT